MLYRSIRVMFMDVGGNDGLISDIYVTGTMSTHESARDEKVKCSLCPVITARRNIARHRRNYHGDSSSVCNDSTAQPSYVTRAVSVTESVGARSRSSSRDTAYPTAASIRSHPERDRTSSTSFLSQVAIAVLDQRHCYTEEELCRYVTPNLSGSLRR